MAPSRTRTMKNKHAAPKGGGHSKGGVTKRSSSSAVDSSSSSGIRKPKSAAARPSAPPKQIKDKTSVRALLQKPNKKKKKTYTAAELGIPALNMVTPVGVVKPKGKKKGKIFVDDRESMNTILSIVQAEKNGQIESKMIKARQMEEIREARRAEAEKKEEDKKSKLEDVKDSLRRKRNKTTTTTTTKNDADDDNIKDLLSTGTKAKKTSKKRVSFV